MLDLKLDKLPPELPQTEKLGRVAKALWMKQTVRAIWVGGSIAQGTADQYSDVDLRIGVPLVAMEEWRKLDLNQIFHNECVGHLLLSIGDESFLHHLVLKNGDIYDLQVQSVTRSPRAEPRLVLGCRDEGFATKLNASTPNMENAGPNANPDVIRQAIVTFWINSHKHRKVLHRHLDLIISMGIQAERQTLIRLWHVHATGKDIAMQGQTIHSITRQAKEVDENVGSFALELTGAPLTDRAAIIRTIEQIRDEVARVGRLLAKQLGFTYPLELETVVREGWKEFLARGR